MEIQGMANEVDDPKIDWKKMKIGILTFHRAHNYGAVLQCYAMQEILRRMGHDVQVIDYRQPWIEDFYKVFSINMLRRNSGSLRDVFAYLKKNAKKFLLAPCKGRNYRRFRDGFFSLTHPCRKDIPQDFDCYLIGSDQLWSLHCLGGEYDPVYMGGFPHKVESRVVGYAISADMGSVESLAAVIERMAGNFSCLSMREAGIASRVSSLAGRKCDVCLDPTLLTDSSLWEKVVDDKWKDRNYVLVYEVRREKKNKGLLRRKAQEIAAQIGDGCKVIDLSSGNYPVSDFVSLFRYARYVITTSFHGTVFSILFQTPFYVLPLWNGYDLRYMELLKNLGAEDRIVSADDVLVPSQVDFAPVMKKLEERRADSVAFIEKALKP